MKNFQTFVTSVFSRNFRTTNKKVEGEDVVELQQTDRNTFRSELLKAFCADVEGTMTKDGIILEIPHEEYGSIFVALDLKVKGINYDIVAAETQYNDEQDEKAFKAAEKARKSADVKKTTKK